MEKLARTLMLIGLLMMLGGGFILQTRMDIGIPIMGIGFIVAIIGSSIEDTLPRQL